MPNKNLGKSTPQESSNPQKDTLLLVDSNSILHRAYHAYPISLVTADGMPINAVYGLASMLLDAILKIKPRYVVCAFDTKAPTFRHTKFTGYKATRAKTDDTLIAQVKLAHQVIEALDLPLMLKEGYEADDILATIANIVKNTEEYKKRIAKILILTSDRDLFALVDNYVHVIIPQGSFKNLKEFGPKEVVEKMGITPKQIYDYKALAGDSSDNIPGVKGVGDKTAVYLLNKFKNLQNIYKNIDKIQEEKKSIATKLINDQQNAFLSYELAQIKQDVPIVFDIKKAHLTDFDFSKAWQLFTKLEFKSLLNKLKNYYILVTGKEPSLTQEKQSPKIENIVANYNKIKLNFSNNQTKYTQILSELTKVLKENNIFYFNQTQATLYYANVPLKKLPKTTIVYPINPNTQAKTTKITPKYFYGLYNFLLLVTKHVYTWQNFAKFIQTLSNFPAIFDISLVAYGLTTGRSNYSLEELATIYADMQEIPNDAQNILNLIAYIAQKQILEINKVQSYKKTFTFLTTIVDPNAILGIAIMQNNGINVNLQQVNAYKEYLTKKLEDLEKQIYDTVGFEFNVKSTKQLANVLFEVLNLPKFKKRKTGYSTDSETLNALYNAHPVIPLILEHRKLQKILSTYVKPYLEIAKENNVQIDNISTPNDKTNTQQTLLSVISSKSQNPKNQDAQTDFTPANIVRIHSQFNPLKTSTGRLASSNPNLQNLPTRTEEGAKIREFFVPDKEHVFIKLDYSQIDLRVLAHTSKEKNMIIAFVQGRDIHKQTASQIFDVPYEKVTDKQRRVAKTINFGIVYGMSAHGLATTLNIKHKEAQEFINKYFERYPGVLEYVKATEEFVKKHGFVLSLLGRRRFIYGITSNNPMRRQAALREAINMPIQGGSDDIIRTAIYEIFRTDKFVQQNIARLVLQIHDELIFEVPNKPEFTNLDDKNSWANKIKTIMENVIKLDVPLKVGVEIGNSVG